MSELSSPSITLAVLELAYRKDLQFRWQLVSTVCKLVNVTVVTDNFSFALTGHARTRSGPVPKPVPTGGDMSLAQFCCACRALAAFWLS
jgi:hypothetical protein